jgi:hypothetical protein
MYSTASTPGHPVFDPGALMFWLLAVPVRLDPGHGLIWGAALLWGLALSLAIEALWSTAHRAGCAVIVLAGIALLWTAPFVMENLAWNAYLPLPFLIVSIVTAFLVADGSYGWWPVLVVAASVSAQSHLLYVIPSAALVLAAPIAGVVNHRSPKRLRWLTVGVGVGLVVWLAPLIQAFGSTSNLSALARGPGKPALGLGFGLRLVGNSADPFPIWLRHAPMSFFYDMAFAYSHSTADGMATVVVLVLVCAVGALTKRRALCALGAVALITSLGLSASFAIIPEANLYVVGYLLPVLWIEGILIWTVVAWCLAAVLGPPILVALGRLISARRPGLPTAGLRHSRARRSTAALSAGVLMGAMGVLLAAAITQLRSANANFGTNWSRDEAQQVASITSFVEHRVPKGPVNVAVENPGSDPTETIAVTEGVGCKLLTDGWQPGLLAVSTPFTDLPPQPGSTRIVVRVRDTTATRSLPGGATLVLITSVADR